MPIAVREYTTLAEMQAEVRRQKAIVAQAKPRVAAPLIVRREILPRNRVMPFTAHISAYREWHQPFIPPAPITPDQLRIRALKASSIGVPPATILQMVCRITGRRRSAICSPRRGQDLIKARFIACWMMRRETNRSFPDIGIILCRDHTSVLHGCQRVDRVLTLLGIDPEPYSPLDLITLLWGRKWPGASE